MLPKPPPREPSIGFLYLPPYRVQGFSVAGEATVVQVPEIDVCFDMGVCPRFALPSKFAAITHGHMDHIGGLAYWCSQRRFQGMGTGTIVCDGRIAPAIHKMMAGFVDLEQQKTPYEVVELDPFDEAKHQLEIKNNLFLRGYPTEHTSPSMGYVVVERRSKLKDEYVGLPQDKLMELKQRDIEITRTFEVPHIAFLGDTAPGPQLVRDDVRKSQIVISECTFFDSEHRGRAKIGMHLHIEDLVEWLRVLECEYLVVTHVSRRTNLGVAMKKLKERVGDQLARKVLFLMDSKTNRERYERQLAEAERAAGVSPSRAAAARSD